MKTTKGLRFRISALIALMLSLTILVVNPIPSAFAGELTLLCIKGTQVKKVAAGSLPVTITLLEENGGKITGNGGRISGTREGNTITVTAQTDWGLRGPYTWQLNGKTITGSWHVTCIDDVTKASLAKGDTSLTMTRP